MGENPLKLNLSFFLLRFLGVVFSPDTMGTPIWDLRECQVLLQLIAPSQNPFLMSSSLGCGSKCGSDEMMMQSQFMLLDRATYQFSLIASLSILARPLSVLIWKNHQSWISVKKRSRRSKSFTLDEINFPRKQHSLHFWHLYQQIQVQGWKRVKQMAYSK